MNTLYLIGNGFDIASGLKSTYSNYFDSVFKKYPEYMPTRSALSSLELELKKELASRQKRKRAITSQIPSAWFFIFAWYKDSAPKDERQWKDVEEIIGQFILPTNCQEHVDSNSSISIEDFHEFVQSKLQQSSIEHSTDPKERVFDLLRQYFEGINTSQIRNQDVNKLRDLFRIELDKLESDFTTYLKKKTTSNQQYAESCEKLLNKMIEVNPTHEEIPTVPIGTVGGPMLSFSSEANNRYLLSFNYTEPFVSKERSKLSHIHMANLHGTISNGNAIFGIDDVHLPANLSKTQKDCIRSFFKDIRCILKEPNTKLDEVKKEITNNGAINVIKVFGCSLGDADYHYFKHYLDAADIIGGNSEIGFYYTGGKKNSPVQSVYSLLERYSIDRGLSDNLFQSLQTSNRLTIESLD